GEARKSYEEDTSKPTSVLLGGRLGWNSLLTSLETKRLRLFATLGASVAITAIFRSPIGGVMFALEETSSFLDLTILWRTLSCTVITYLIVSYEIAFVFNKGATSKQFDPEQAVHFPVSTNCARPIPYQDFISYIFMAVLAALLSQLWNTILGQIQKLRLRFIIQSHDKNLKLLPKPFGFKKFSIGAIRLLEVVLVCLVTTVVTIGVPMIPGLDDCTSVYVPTKHVNITMPQVCHTLVNVTEFESCLQSLDNVCLPTEMTNIWRTQIVESYFAKSNITRQSSTNALSEHGAPLINLKRRQEHATTTNAAHSGTVTNAHSTTSAEHAESTSSTHADSTSSEGSSSHGETVHLTAEQKLELELESLKLYSEAYVKNNSQTLIELKSIPYYPYPEDKLKGNAQKG
ncbi:hypothetical protein HK096_010917, partial [Nowakowskiella sp. JEL0078]